MTRVSQRGAHSDGPISNLESRSRPWRKLAFGVAASLITVGLAPLAYLEWSATAYSTEPLVFPLSLKQGTYTSPSFRTDSDEDYQVELYFVPADRSPLNIDWKIVVEQQSKEVVTGRTSNQAATM